MGRFDGRVAIVTGAAHGASAPASAKRFAEEGASVAILDLDEDQAQRHREPTSAATPRPSASACNVSDGASVEAAVARVLEELGGVHILVNNAGITRDNLLFKLTEDDWDSVMGVHLKGAFLMSKAVQKTFVDQKYGKILEPLQRLGQRQPRPGQLLRRQGRRAGLHPHAGARARQVRRQRQRDRAGLHRHRDDRRHRPPARGRASRSSAPLTAEANPVKRVGPPRGHRRRGCVPVQRRGVVHHRPDALRRRRRQDLSQAEFTRQQRRALRGSRGPPCHADAHVRSRSRIQRSALPASRRSSPPSSSAPRSLPVAAARTASADKPDSQPVAGGTELAALWPLTGRAGHGQPRRIARCWSPRSTTPRTAARRSGLKKADLITEELVEGGMTRLAVFFYQQLPDVAGPGALDACLRHRHRQARPRRRSWPAAPRRPPCARLKRANVTFFTEGGPGYYRDGSRHGAVQPDGAHARAGRGREEEGRRPGELPAVGQGVRLHRRPGRPKSRRDLQPFAHHVVDATRAASTSTPTATPPRATGSSPTACSSCACAQGDAGYLDPAGNKVPETLYFGRGPAHALPQRPGRARHLDEEVAKRARSRLSTAAGSDEGAGRPRVDRAGADRQGRRQGHLPQVARAAGPDWAGSLESRCARLDAGR